MLGSCHVVIIAPSDARTWSLEGQIRLPPRTRCSLTLRVVPTSQQSMGCKVAYIVAFEGLLAPLSVREVHKLLYLFQGRNSRHLSPLRFSAGLCWA